MEQGQKTRIVFDAKANRKGFCLNDALLQGPDLTTPLIDVLLRFRIGKHAYAADIKGIFNQVLVPPPHRDMFRFLWWKDGNISSDPITYRVKSHVFGAKRSPSCANFALRKTADEATGHSVSSRSTLKTNFYVDDCMKASDCEFDLAKNAKDVQEICALGGFRLTKFVSNAPQVLNRIPTEDKAPTQENVGLDNDPNTKTPGLIWDLKHDLLKIRKKHMEDKPATMRGVLSSIASTYDPLE